MFYIHLGIELSKLQLMSCLDKTFLSNKVSQCIQSTLLNNPGSSLQCWYRNTSLALHQKNQPSRSQVFSASNQLNFQSNAEVISYLLLLYMIQESGIEIKNTSDIPMQTFQCIYWNLKWILVCMSRQCKK